MHYIQPATLDLVRLHELNPDRYPYLLESVAHGTRHSRYDILFAFPQQSLHLSADHTLWGEGSAQESNFLCAFEKWFQRESAVLQTDHNDSGLPFHGGWFIYLAYELVREIESGLDTGLFSDNQTIGFAARCPAALIVDHQEGELIYFTEDKRADLMTLLQQDVASLDTRDVPPGKPFGLLDVMIEEPPERYLQAVKIIRDYIIDGDVFQVNLSRLWQTTLRPGVTASDLYRNLRLKNPAPFAGLAVFDDMAIISSSPERLVSVRDGQVETRPIAGTRPRSTQRQEDARLSDELLGHPKEQAEHIMLIDLERNDLGRVCIPGSIHVDELMSLESFAHVHHIVSNVRGQLRDDVNPIDVIRAVFPGGTITGCPKVRCMQIIAQLEQSARGAYTGSMGYVNLDGSMDLNILIRTLVKSASQVSLRAGAGIVYDSDPQHELDETRAKARGLLRSLAVESS